MNASFITEFYNDDNDDDDTCSHREISHIICFFVAQ